MARPAKMIKIVPTRSTMFNVNGGVNSRLIKGKVYEVDTTTYNAMMRFNEFIFEKKGEEPYFLTENDWKDLNMTVKERKVDFTEIEAKLKERENELNDREAKLIERENELKKNKEAK